jgi:hypothetical protein
MAWNRKLPSTISLRDGRTIATLAEARALMLALPVRHQVRPFWQYAAELMLEAAQRDDKIEDAYHQLTRALTAEGLL